MKVSAFFEFGDVSAARWHWLQRCWALFGMLLILATWKLWTPQTVYPQVPLVEVAGVLPVACQWAALAVAIASLAVALCLSPRMNDTARAWLSFAFVVAMLVLMLTDQHRLQPWAYQLVIYAIVLGSMPSDRTNRRRGFALLRILTLSIYLYSSLGKFDFQFLHTVGQQFLDVLFGFFGFDVQHWPSTVRLLLAAMFPLVELLLIVALVVPRLRRIGVVLAVLLHGSLIMLLGPWGLGHQLGVLIWNVFFIVQAALLFSDFKRTTEAAGQADPHDRTPGRWFPTCTILVVVFLPLLEPIGWYDHWPSWGLYSPRNSRAIVEVHRVGLRSLPAELQPYLARADEDAGWVLMEIDEWSLGTLSVPIYPQDRFQLGVAESIAAQYKLDRTIRVRLLGMSNRMTGAREEKTLTGRQQIVAAASRFRLNSHPAEVAND